MADEAAGTTLTAEAPPAAAATSSTADAAATTETTASSAPSTPTDWRASLAPELQTDKSLAAIKDVGALAKSYVAAQKLLGSSVRLPGEPPAADATPAEKAAYQDRVARYRESVGVPKTPADYTFPEGLEPSAVDWARATFHELGVPGPMAGAIAEKWAAFEGERLNRQQQQWVEELRTLKQEWGEPLYNRRATAAHRFVMETAEEAGMKAADVKAWLDASRLGDHPFLVRLFAAAGEATLEDHVIDGRATTRDDVAARIKAIEADPRHPAMDGNHPEYRTARAALMDLYKLAYPGTRQ